MGIFKSIGDFLFGKTPDIFDDQGRVLHHFPRKKWEDWDKRISANSDYNWRNHTGTLAGAKPVKQSEQKPN